MSKYANKAKERDYPKKRETFEVDTSLLESEWIKCPKCHEDLKSQNLEHHLGKVHHVKMIERKKGNNGPLPLIALIVVITVAIASGTYLFINSNKRDVDTDIEEPMEGWLANYSPRESVGSSEGDWWIMYPNQNPNWAEKVNHPSWITQKLANGPILIFAHSNNCMPCVQQQESIDGIMKNYGSEIHLFDYLSGEDARASEAFQIYDPNGSPNYIPLTVIITIVKDSSGNEAIGWHGMEGATGGEWLTKYVQDAIYYHNENIDEWS